MWTMIATILSALLGYAASYLDNKANDAHINSLIDERLGGSK